ncbi:GspE/PulE family protein [Leeia sp. TBRC 13508]|uniref:GspE/PulE family protein n=1 Tax=Leeia speluncae TaxID=2884804 RepID=A0ABS8D662_9NEIS|nr:GspE/PulE family protein [Leeia speluncae]MCB6183680.1 GspE/PulE family protein [Leeia speluncae]
MLQKKLIRVDQLTVALIEQKSTLQPIGQLIIAAGFTSREAVSIALCALLERRVCVDIQDIQPCQRAISYLSASQAKQLTVCPMRFDIAANELHIACLDSEDLLVKDQLRKFTPANVTIKLFQALAVDLNPAIEQIYRSTLNGSSVGNVLKFGAELDAPSLNELFALAIAQNASDMHFVPEKTYFSVKFRIDGVLLERGCWHLSLWPSLSIQIKVLAGLDIAESRGIQEGRFSYQSMLRMVECRVSILPIDYGESVVIRFLKGADWTHGLDALQLTSNARNRLSKLLLKRDGLILFCGPTGSGKTTSLYALLSELNRSELNIISLEDPVEYRLQGVRQASIGEYLKLNFASGMKASLRQDPDILFIGEIRDTETAKIAMTSALSGHLVFATVHAHSIVSAWNRLLDFGISQQMLTANISAIITQRLIRRLCPCCKAAAQSNHRVTQLCEQHQLKLPQSLFQAMGCDDCFGIGYKGRLPVMEVDFPQSMGAISSVFRGAESNITEYSLLEDAWQRVIEGLTTPAELSRLFSLEESLA